MLSPSVKKLLNEQADSPNPKVIKVPTTCYRQTTGGEIVPCGTTAGMEDYASETDSDYTSYWRDWVGQTFVNLCSFCRS